jgi:hypothetical protein
MKILVLVSLLISPILKAYFFEIADGVYLDLGSHREFVPMNCSLTPGEVCIWHCYKVINETSGDAFSCAMEGTGFYKEKIKTASGDLFTGNKLIATDYRTLPVYPYQDAEICFNFGKEIIKYPAQPSQTWVFTKAIISADCGNGRRGSREYGFTIF